MLPISGSFMVICVVISTTLYFLCLNYNSMDFDSFVILFSLPEGTLNSSSGHLNSCADCTIDIFIYLLLQQLFWVYLVGVSSKAKLEKIFQKYRRHCIENSQLSIILVYQ